MFQVMHRNERMLEESRDTFTVPASFVWAYLRRSVKCGVNVFENLHGKFTLYCLRICYLYLKLQNYVFNNFCKTSKIVFIIEESGEYMKHLRLKDDINQNSDIY